MSANGVAFTRSKIPRDVSTPPSPMGPGCPGRALIDDARSGTRGSGRSRARSAGYGGGGSGGAGGSSGGGGGGGGGARGRAAVGGATSFLLRPPTLAEKEIKKPAAEQGRRGDGPPVRPPG